MDHRGLRRGRRAHHAARDPDVLPPRGNLGRQADPHEDRGAGEARRVRKRTRGADAQARREKERRQDEGRAPRKEGNCENLDRGEEARGEEGVTREESAGPQGAREEVVSSAPALKLVVVAVGQKVPDWAQAAWDDYAKRFP